VPIEEIYREESGRVLATLIRLLGSFELAEEATQEAFAAALAQWPHEGVPQNPRAWLVSTGRHKALDVLRRERRFERRQPELERLAALEGDLARDAPVAETGGVEDDRLRLIFTCCHPALMVEAQVALTLRTLGGLATEEIAKAFLVPLPTMAQRIVRAKQKIRDAGIPYRVPPVEELPERVASVALVVYLVFNEGYNAGSGDVLIRRELCAEAIRLGRLLSDLMPGTPEAQGLLALMLLHDSRRDARVSQGGDLIPLEEQDRGLWHQGQIDEGLVLTESALRRAPGPYSVQAAIASVHARARRAADTDWREIARLYDVLVGMHPSPVVELNRAVAHAMALGPEEGLRLIDGLSGAESLRGYYLVPAARGDLARRLERWSLAAAAYREALALATNAPERRFLEKRLAEAEAQARVDSARERG
jgi:RNA polymerase sigma-70 factor (ECF subfamily)